MSASFRHAWRFWLAALAFAWLVDFLFWRKPLGISFPLWVLVVLAGSLFIGLGEGHRPHLRTLLLMALTLAAALITVLRNEVMTRFLNAVLSLGLLLLLADTYSNGFWLFYRLGDYFKALARLTRAALVDPFRLGKATALPAGAEDVPFWRLVWRKFVPVLRGLVLALPVVIVLGALLASADPIFADWMKSLLKVFDLSRLFEYLFRLFYILILAYAFAGLLTHAIHPQQEADQPDPQRGWFKPFLGALESGVVLFCVDLLFLVFVIIQFRYFFGGQANITETGYTYSEYARRGFGELVTVAVLSLLLYLSLASISRLDTPVRRRSFTLLSVFLMMMVLVMLVSAYQRLWLYESAYGFTQLRTYTHVFIPWLGALLLAVVVFEMIQQRGRFGLALLIFNIGFVLTLGVLNVDGFIARQNIRRTLQGEALDLSYLSSLSSDAVPVILQEFDNPALMQETHDQLGGELACRAALLLEEEKRPWQAFHLSTQTARSLLFARHSEWQAYPISRQGSGWLWVTVNGETRPCRMTVFWD